MPSQVFKTDAVMNDEMVSQFASLVKDIPTGVIANFESLFEDDKHPEFYKGLLTGYVNGYNLVMNPETSTEQLGAIAAFVANKDVKEAIEYRLEESRKLSYLGLMASAVAHELNQPIGIIRAATSAAKDDIDEKLFRSDDIKTYIERIWKQTERLNAIIENFRRFARGDRTRCERLNINSVIEETVALFEEQFRHRNIELIKKNCQNPIPEVWANPFQLEEVIINLLTNARDAVEGIKNATVWIKIWCDEKEAGFRVEDNGSGIAHKHRPHIFIPFFSTKSADHSTGMGLYISHKIIEELGGRLAYEDKTDRGACFVVALPSYSQRK